MEPSLLHGAPGSKLAALCYSGAPAAHPSCGREWHLQERVATPELVFVEEDLRH